MKYSVELKASNGALIANTPYFLSLNEAKAVEAIFKNAIENSEDFMQNGLDTATWTTMISGQQEAR